MVRYIGSGTVTAAGIAEAAASAGIEVNALKAVLAVETNGKPYDKSSRLSMLFEPHVFYRILSHQAGGSDQLKAAIGAELAYPKWGEKPYPKDSYPRFLLACKINEELACRAASWGMGQILGDNYHDLGYGSAVQLVEMMAAVPDEQVHAVATFCKVNHLVTALNAHDWATFAHHYNGPNYTANHYDAKLEAAFAGLPPSPRVVVEGDSHSVAAVPPAASLDTDRPPAGLRDRMAVVQATSPAAAGTRASAAKPQSKDHSMDPLKLISDAFVPSATASTYAPASGGMLGADDIRWAQQRLKDLGYFEVGIVDGKGGKRTEGAILAFRNDNGLPLDPNLDDGLKLALISGKPRNISAERAQANAATLRPESPILQAASSAKTLSIITGGVGLATSYFGAIGGNIGTATSQLEPFRLLFGFIPGWVWGLLVVVLGTLIWIQATAVERARVKQFQTGRAS